MNEAELRALIHWLEINESKWEKGWWGDWSRAASITISGVDVRKSVPRVLYDQHGPMRARLLMLWIDSYWGGTPAPAGASHKRWINQLRQMLPHAAKSPHPDARRQK